MTDEYPTKIFATKAGTWKLGDDMGVEYVRWDMASCGDYYEGIQEGWNAAEVENKRLREALSDAVRYLEYHEPYPKPCFQRARYALRREEEGEP